MSLAAGAGAERNLTFLCVWVVGELLDRMLPPPPFDGRYYHVDVMPIDARRVGLRVNVGLVGVAGTIWLETEESGTLRIGSYHTPPGAWPTHPFATLDELATLIGGVLRREFARGREE